ncbi:hypothetical protein KCP69_11210 [Salmonella enterica subsp. enterica]|nr:hypothetical protein KCP69_11210 [Salmonella enterica subsp. enterica]
MPVQTAASRRELLRAFQVGKAHGLFYDCPFFFAPAFHINKRRCENIAYYPAPYQPALLGDFRSLLYLATQLNILPASAGFAGQ